MKNCRSQFDWHMCHVVLVPRCSAADLSSGAGIWVQHQPYLHCYFRDCHLKFRLRPRCGGCERTIDVTRAGHPIVQSTLVLSSLQHHRHTGANVCPMATLIHDIEEGSSHFKKSTSRRSRVGVGMNRSAREGKSVKRFERSNGLDTALYKNYLFFNSGPLSLGGS